MTTLSLPGCIELDPTLAASSSLDLDTIPLTPADRARLGIWVGPDLPEALVSRVALLLQYAAAATLARRVVLPALVRAGAMLRQGVVAGPRRVVVTSGVEIKECA